MTDEETYSVWPPGGYTWTETHQLVSDQLPPPVHVGEFGFSCWRAHSGVSLDLIRQNHPPHPHPPQPSPPRLLTHAGAAARGFLKFWVNGNRAKREQRTDDEINHRVSTVLELDDRPFRTRLVLLSDGDKSSLRHHRWVFPTISIQDVGWEASDFQNVNATSVKLILKNQVEKKMNHWRLTIKSTSAFYGREKHVIRIQSVVQGEEEEEEEESILQWGRRVYEVEKGGAVLE